VFGDVDNDVDKKWDYLKEIIYIVSNSPPCVDGSNTFPDISSINLYATNQDNENSSILSVCLTPTDRISTFTATA